MYQLIDMTWQALNDLGPVSKLARRGASLLYTLKPAPGQPGTALVDLWRSEWKGDAQKVLQRVQDSMALGHATFADSARHVMGDIHNAMGDQGAEMTSGSPGVMGMLDTEESTLMAGLDLSDLCGFPWSPGYENSNFGRQI